MKRYDLEAEDCMGGWASRDVMNEREQGDWVHHADHQKVVTDLTSLALEARQKTQQASAAADELRGMVTAGAKMTAQLRARIAELEAAIAQRDCRVARLEHELKYALSVAGLLGPALARVTQLEDGVAMLIHPHDLAAYRAKKSLHK